MSQLTLQLLLLALASWASAKHFYGGTMYFFPRGQSSDGAFLVDIRYKAPGCPTVMTWECLSGNCGKISSFDIKKVDSSSSGLSWCQSDAVMILSLPSNKPFEFRDHSCCWIANVGGVQAWKLLTHIDLGTRSDANAPNRSPVAGAISLIRLPNNCQRNINFLSHDPDVDQVRCRYGEASDSECTSCIQHTNFNLDEDACVLHYSGNTNLGSRVFELVVEDFPRQGINVQYSDGSRVLRVPLSSPVGSGDDDGLSSNATPLSRIPLHFIVQIDGAVPSCTDGEYLPLFRSPTPPHGDILLAYAETEFSISLNAVSTRATMNDFFISGPINIMEENTFSGSTGHSTIMWTPTERDIDIHIPICFMAESKAGNNFYHSEMRCIVVLVGPKLEGEANVICSENTMTVEVEKSSIIGLHEDHLHLNDPSCTLMSNATHVFATMSLNSCGTQLEEDAENLIYKNEITSFEDPSSVITRRHEVEIGFSCEYSKTAEVILEFTPHKLPFAFTETGFGKFTYQFEFYHSSQFSQMVDPSTYPVDVPLKEMIYMEIESTSSIPNTVLFVESCKATPENDPNSNQYYDIIENGCTVDDTVVVYAENGPDYKFGMQAFKFIGDFNEVFIYCSVILCKSGDPATRCAQGCLNNPVKRRRSVGLETASHYISQGPLRLKRSADTVRSDLSTTSLNMNLVFITGTLFTLVPMVCGVMIFKSKRSKVKYQKLPNFEF